MAQPQLMQIKLSRFDAQPWGFRLQGGVDFAAPLLVQKVNGGSLAEQAGLLPGDAVLKINDVDVFNLRHKDAQDIVVRSGNNFVVTVQRGGSTWRPHVTPTGHVPQPNQNSPYLQTVTKTSLAHKQQESQHIGCGYNNAARPFVNGGDGSVKSIVNKQYNTPVGIYSDESIAETLSAQAEVLAGGVLGVNFKKNEKEYQADKSEVLKFLREEETGQSTPEPHSPANFYWTHSHAIGGNERRSTRETVQQEQVQKTTEKRVSTSLVQSKVASSSTATTVSASNVSSAAAVAPATVATPSEKPDPRIIMMPVCPALQGPEYKAEMEAAAAALAHDDGQRPLSASGHPACQLCGVGIVGVFVRIKDKNLHVECFKCATCGTSLKNQGYYNFNNKLYCDIHAKLAAMQNPPAGTEGYVPVPIKPNTKLSATTISSALNAHGFNGVSNGSSTPTPAPAPAPVNQGYARPFGAAPPSAAPKSPISYPPQPQQWASPPQQQAPKPASNPYATLPRSNVGQQGKDDDDYLIESDWV
ncbi:PDZ and LIM domain protein Zasp isoform X10 [Teleopsis dalmanni]|uniref:PDZ and LIM domain protein Zasp isoform X10 n=1 Tax=Teleopsis dalmanni TaxID=139649 RepID=UPI0018CCE58C|nr:PDZ and LIM domain protein Zasp isoform X10 [Teleopsis dalmanni]